MKPEVVLGWLRAAGAWKQDGHFKGVGGEHFREYFEGNELLTSKGVYHLGNLCFELCRSLPKGIEVVTGPPRGANAPAVLIGSNLNCAVVPMEKKRNGAYTIVPFFRESFKDKRVLVFDDFTSTGGSLEKACSFVERFGGEVFQVATFVNRAPGRVASSRFGGVPFTALADYEVESWKESDCPLCEKGIPLSPIFGHG